MKKQTFDVFGIFKKSHKGSSDMNNETDTKKKVYISAKDQKYVDTVLHKYQKDVDTFSQMYPTAQKTEQIQMLVARIVKVKATIKKTFKDSDLSTEDKIKKIQRCVEIIKNTEFSLRSSLEFLKYRMEQTKVQFEQLSRMK